MRGRGYRLIQRWVSWYRHGGLVELLQRVTGHEAQGVEAKLCAVQQKALIARLKVGDFATVWDVMAFNPINWFQQIQFSVCVYRAHDHVVPPHSILSI
jgi:hypothetical protein